MNLYQINEAIKEVIDFDTGEILDEVKYKELEITRQDKIESLGVFYKDTLGDIQKYEAEMHRLSTRKKQLENRAKTLKKMIDQELNGKKFETTKVRISYRKSKVLRQTAEEYNLNPKYLKITETVDKLAIKNDIANGVKVEGFELVENSNIQIK